MDRMQDSHASHEAHLLVVDDEPNIRDLLASSLRFAGFEVTTAADGNGALHGVDAADPDLIVLDVMLPDMDGFTVARRLRERDITTPILFLTARDDMADKVQGLTVGGDDYVTKPFGLEEVVARIRAILRRTNGTADEDDGVVRVADLILDEDAHEVHRSGVDVELSPTEFKLLRYLMLNAGRVVSKAQILDHVWEYDWNGDAAIVESYISYLRRKVDQIEGQDGRATYSDPPRGGLHAARAQGRVTGAHRQEDHALTHARSGPRPPRRPAPSGLDGPGSQGALRPADASCDQGSSVPPDQEGALASADLGAAVLAHPAPAQSARPDHYGAADRRPAHRLLVGHLPTQPASHHSDRRPAADDRRDDRSSGTGPDPRR